MKTKEVFNRMCLKLLFKIKFSEMQLKLFFVYKLQLMSVLRLT